MSQKSNILAGIAMGPYAVVSLWPPWHQRANQLLKPLMDDFLGAFTIFSLLWLGVLGGFIVGRISIIRAKTKDD